MRFMMAQLLLERKGLAKHVLREAEGFRDRL